MRLRIKSTEFTIKVLAWLQIFGGIIGIGVMAYVMLNTGQINGGGLLIILIGLALFIFSIYAGRRLLDKRTLKLGIILSIINQGFQILHFKIEGFGFSYSSGSELLIGYKENISFNYGLISSTFQMSLNTDSSEFYLMVNVLAMFLLFVLFDIWDEIKEDNEPLNHTDVEEYEYTMANRVDGR